MPVSPTYPGIYIQETQSTVHTITPAPTNIAVFLGYTHPFKTLTPNWGQPVLIFGFSDYQRNFGGFLRSAVYAQSGASQWVTGGVTYYADPQVAPGSSFGDMASAVYQFFLNGGQQAYIVGLLPQTTLPLGPSATSSVTAGIVTQPNLGITFTAREITDTNFVMTLTLRPIAATLTGSPPGAEQADVIITYGPAPGPQPGMKAPSGTITETYRRVTLTPQTGSPPPPADPNFAETRIGTATAPVSQLVTVSVGNGPAPGYLASLGASVTWTFTNATLPAPTTPSTSDFSSIFYADDFTQVMQENTPLDKLPVFNLMVIPGVTNSLVLSTAERFCENHYAFLICDPPLTDSADGSLPHFPDTILNTINGNNLDENGVPIEIPTSANAALYFPYLLSPDPVTGASLSLATGAPNEIPPAPTVAGIFAATDLSRGVWKAPAGFQATTTNTNGVVPRGKMTDPQQGLLNPVGVNCLRDFPNIGTTVFGARTLVTLTNQQWRYVSVRRMALFLEQTFLANLKWVLFEPNDEPLWSAIVVSINDFMLGLFNQGAFQGSTPSQAFSVQCDSTTTTQTDIDAGVVNIVVGFAPLLPAEFVVITITQLAGQATS
jgi:phage tail sheath protein FI